MFTPVQKKRIAFCYWGMTRSVRLVHPSHTERLLGAVRGLSSEVYLHTWETAENRIWDRIDRHPVDPEEYRLLRPTVFRRDSQDDFLRTITFSDYFDEAAYKKYGGDSPHEWRPGLLRNHLCALESLKRVFQMAVDSGIRYDFVVFVRPDVWFCQDLDRTVFFDPGFDICIPDENHHEGYNDRFAILPFRTAHFYARRIDVLRDFRKHHGRIVAEKFCRFIIDKHYPRIRFLHLPFRIIRPGWSVADLHCEPTDKNYCRHKTLAETYQI